MIRASQAELDYIAGYEAGYSARKNGGGTSTVSGSPYWWNLGYQDGYKSARRFNFDNAFWAADTDGELAAYQEGAQNRPYTGNPKDRAFYDQGRANISNGYAKPFLLMSNSTTRTAPPYVGNTAPNDPILNPPPSGRVAPMGRRYRPRRPVPPWQYGNGTGFVMYGDGYYIDLGKLFKGGSR